MPLQIKIYNGMREIYDDLNPRIYRREWKCAECREWIDEDDTVWIDPKTGKATMEGNPYHTECAPPEYFTYECWNCENYFETRYYADICPYCGSNEITESVAF